jgi:hypothetical protein
MRFLPNICMLVGLQSAIWIFLTLVGLVYATGDTHVHDESFIPDIVLRVTATNYSQTCYERYSVLINGSSPGPVLRLREGETTWIRVYNDIKNTNLTMVFASFPRPRLQFADRIYGSSSIGMA